MPFIWSSNPNPPPVVPPIIIGPEEVSFKVHVVANTVNVGGAVSYNTPNEGYDVVYELDLLNVRNMRVQTGIFDHANIGTAIINTATINQATINTANIIHATINIGYFTGNATANFSMVSKQYVDNAIAAISGGTGPDSTANLILMKGDLLVGFAPNTAHRLGVGTNGQVLSVYGSSNVGLRWVDAAGSQVVEGLDIGTHYHPTLKFSQVLLRHADGIVMDDGEFVGGWDNLTADVTTTGVGGLDSVSVEAANTWYEVWAIRNSSSGAKGLLLHRMLERDLDQRWDGQAGASAAVLGTGAEDLTAIFQRRCSKLSQSIVAQQTGVMRSVLFRATPGTSPGDIRRSEGNTWATFETPDGTGNSVGTIHATSRTFTTLDMGSGQIDLYFVFDTNPVVTSGNKYIFVIHQDWVINIGSSSSGHANVFGMNFFGNTAPLGAGQQAWMANVGYNGGGTYFPYANIGFGDARTFNLQSGFWSTLANVGGPSDLFFKTFVEANETALSLPAGYNQSALLSFVRNDSSGNFKEYRQKDRTLMLGTGPSWELAPHDTSLPGLSQGMFFVDLSDIVPPIPCTTQFLAVPHSGGPVSFGMKFGTIQALDVFLNLSNKYKHGMYSFGPGGSPSGFINMMLLDGLQTILFYDIQDPAVTCHVYPVSITF